MADEEDFFVVVRVDEPSGDAVGVAAFDFAGLRFEDVDSVDLHLHLIRLAFDGQQVDVRFAEDHEQIAFAGVLQVFGHVQVGVHAGFEHRDAAQSVELGRVSFVVERTGDQYVELGVATFASRFHQIGSLDGAKLGADEDARTFLDVAFHVATFGTDSTLAGPGDE